MLGNKTMTVYTMILEVPPTSTTPLERSYAKGP